MELKSIFPNVDFKKAEEKWEQMKMYRRKKKFGAPYEINSNKQ